MEKDIVKILKELRKIEPDAGYSQHSRFLILSSTVKKDERKLAITDKIYNYFHIHYLLLPELAVAVAIFISGVYLIVSYLPGNQNGLVAEANEINASIQIELNGIKYNLENQPQISSSTASDVSNKLEKAAKELEAAKDLSADGAKLKEVLEKIKASQEALVEINGLLVK
ncbi:hypothetical protein HZB06_02590 [Candidatus Wolfebacteria bacterium]|nr:hypothetical protein [Candidatus Wolfebacteria bacterium]